MHIIAPLPGQSIDSAVFETMLRCDAFLALATKDYGADTGNTASTYHEVRIWKEKYQPKGKPLIPLRMVSGCFCCCARAADLLCVHRSRGATTLIMRLRASFSARTYWH